MVAISGDDQETLKEYKASLRASFPFVPDPDGRLMELFDVKYPLFNISARYSFVIGTGRKVIEVFSGSDAVAAQKALDACGRPGKSEPLEAAKAYRENNEAKQQP